MYREVVNATQAHGGIGRNVIPSEFILNVNLRFPPDRDPGSAEAYMRKLVGSDAEVEVMDLAPAAPPALNNALLKRLAGEYGLEVRAKQAWTDVARFAGIGVPAVNFGPGVGALAHQQNESIPVSHMVQSFEILKDLLGLS